MPADEPLVETWNIASRVTLYLLDAIPPEALSDRVGSRGRTVGAVFAHLHNNRLMWLEVAAPELLAGLAKIEKEQIHARDHLRRSLEASGQAMASLFQTGVEKGRIKGFKRSVAAFLGYAIAHEAYHHGEIGIMLAQSGHPLDSKTAYGLWEWGKL